MKTDNIFQRKYCRVLMLYILPLTLINCSNNKSKETLVTLDSSYIVSPVNPPADLAFAVNCGGKAYKASNGITYQTDNNFVGGFSHEINTILENTDDVPLFQSGHFGRNFTYNIPLENGIYKVTFGFIENYNSTDSSRQFDVLAEGDEIIRNLDIFNIAGKNKVFLINKTVTIKDDTLNLRFKSDKGDAMIAALHIIRQPLKANDNLKPATPPINFAVNGGGSSFKALSGIVYQEDQYFSGGFSHHVITAISNTTDDSLYQAGHYGTDFSYNIPLANSTYRITMHFVENYNSKSGARQFDVLAEGAEIIPNLDIFQVTGKGKAYSLTKTITLKDDTLNLRFKADKGDAMVSGFYITEK